MTVIVITIEDLDPAGRDGNVTINIKRLAKPGEPEDTPASQLAEFVERVIDVYIANQGGKLAKNIQPSGERPCLH